MFNFKKQKKTETQDMTEPTMQQKVGDNTIEAGLPENAHKKNKNISKIFLFVAGSVGVLLLVLSLIISAGKKPTEEQTLVKPGIANKTPKNFATDKTDIGKDKKDIEDARAAAEQATVAETPPPPPPPPPKPNTEIPDRKMAGNVLVAFDAQARTKTLSGSPTAQASSQESSLGGMLNRTATVSVKAMQRGDLTYLLTKGTSIACTLETRIITTLPGLTRCRVTKDIYSANGKALLIERGSSIIGEQTSALLHGQARVFVLWTDVETPNGIKIAIDSPTAGQLGAAGQAADIDNHFWQRFGGAIMLSMIGDFSNALSNRISAKSKQSDLKITFEETQDAAEKMAEIALQNSINIPPTGYINQGSLLNVMIARDVDFSDVYEVINPYTYDMQ